MKISKSINLQVKIILSAVSEGLKFKLPCPEQPETTEGILGTLGLLPPVYRGLQSDRGTIEQIASKGHKVQNGRSGNEGLWSIKRSALHGSSPDVLQARGTASSFHGCIRRRTGGDSETRRDRCQDRTGPLETHSVLVQGAEASRKELRGDRTGTTSYRERIGTVQSLHWRDTVFRGHWSCGSPVPGLSSQ